MDLNMLFIRADIIAARQAIEYFEQRQVKEIKNVAAYHLQQACEKMIKIQIYRSGIRTDNSQLYVHNLVKLINYARLLSVPAFVLPKAIDANALMITDWEAGSRYDLRFSVRIDVLRNMLKVVTDWYDDLYRMGVR